MTKIMKTRKIITMKTQILRRNRSTSIQKQNLKVHMPNGKYLKRRIHIRWSKFYQDVISPVRNIMIWLHLFKNYFISNCLILISLGPQMIEKAVVDSPIPNSVVPKTSQWSHQEWTGPRVQWLVHIKQQWSRQREAVRLSLQNPRHQGGIRTQRI